MNSLWQVVRTYLWRPRFWVLGVAYGWIMWLNLSTPERPPRAQVALSVMMGGLVVCFVALHVRRQFGSEGAQLTPRYVLPHLAVGALATTFFWVVLPSAMTLTGRWPPGALAAHGLVGILAGAVAFWPKALMLLLALPFLLSWSNTFDPLQRRYIERFLDGGEPVEASALLVAALAANVIAAIWLVRLPRSGVAANDDLALETPVPSESNPLAAWTLAGRDASALRLGHARLLRAVQRWRVPVAIAPFQFLLPALAVLVSAAIGWGFEALSAWAMVGTIISSAVLLVVPYGPWHLRRRAFGQEFMRPVTRATFFRQIALALAWDVVAWLAAASLTSLVVFAAFARFSGIDQSGVIFVTGYYAVLWSMAAFLYGLALTTMRWRMWLLVIAVGGMGWFLGVSWLGVYGAFKFGWRPMHSVLHVWAFALLSAIVGLLLAWLTYRRWLRSDVA
jgi:hypothetical protein